MSSILPDKPAVRCLGAIVVLLAICLVTARGAEPTPNIRHEIILRANIAGNRLVDITPDAATVKAIDFRPGDVVTIKRTGVSALHAERWTQPYTWKEKVSKNMRVYHQPSIQEWTPEWGINLNAEVAGSDPQDFKAKLGLRADRPTYRVGAPSERGQVQVLVTVTQPNRICPPPNSKASPEGPVQIIPLVQPNARVGSIIIEIARPTLP